MSEQTNNIAVEQPAEADPEATAGGVDAAPTPAETPAPADGETAVTPEDTAADAGPVAEAAAHGSAVERADEEAEADHAEADHAEADHAEDEGADEADTDEADTDEDGDDDDGDPLDTEGEVAADYLEELLDIADLDGDIDTYVESGRAHVSVVTESQVLVGKDGEVLEALQDLVRLAVVAETGHRSRLMLDVAGHREKRRRELVDLATDAVQEVRTSSEAVRLSPMNPFERKIVHDAVAAAGLTSESEGEEPQRRVVVMP